ncbi:amidohydrolase [Streptomyces sp. NBC_01260]|uniref:amidohydrolase n=1 Tax=unclassified Streptomyces TaxID=2593676 RepID=UPI000FA5B312|nr:MULTISPECIES: amidohydrolase [unclassified Streptomyces]MCX4774393.1 amidohydrolase [Streptomyces sp. NBC_01285]ROQ73128.1 hippurate hydrolase [Streptomyces sp. CEV 2-1]RPK35897.1 putative hydrolase YxeP [Streptomyces sp. ADI92-24]
MVINESMGMKAHADDVLAGLAGIRSELEDFYKDLHAHPELGHREHRTAARVAQCLTGWGYQVHKGVGGTGVVGVLANGDGPVVLLRADMDALPIREETGLPYASAVTAAGASGREVPVAHACGHDMHVTCLLGAARLMSGSPEAWQGTLVTLFQPAEEPGDGADRMVADGLADRIPRPDLAFAQHVLPYPAGLLGTRSGSFLSAADNLKITVYGRGAHGSAPQAAIDPVVMASMIVVRLQTIISRELAATQPAVLTVGSVHAGTTGNVIPDSAEIQLNVRTYDEATRKDVLAAVRRIVKAECDASRATRDPDYEEGGRFPPTVNDEAITGEVSEAFTAYFGERAHTSELQSASEDFSRIPDAFGIPYTYWGIGCVDPETYRAAEQRGTVAQDIPVNHSARFAPVLQPTLDTGVQALVVASLTRLANPDDESS